MLPEQTLSACLTHRFAAHVQEITKCSFARTDANFTFVHLKLGALDLHAALAERVCETQQAISSCRIFAAQICFAKKCGADPNEPPNRCQ